VDIGDYLIWINRPEREADNLHSSTAEPIEVRPLYFHNPYAPSYCGG